MRVETTISPETDKKLTDLCEQTNITRRELIRRAIDSYCDQQFLLNEIMKMGHTIIEAQAVQLARIDENRSAVLKVATDNTKACVDASKRNYDAIQSIADRLTEIERRLMIVPSATVIARKVANAACYLTFLLSMLPALFQFNGLV